MTDRQDGKVALLGRPPIDALALERLASEALTSGDFETAHRYIDRRCRIEPPALAHCFVLRAESAQRMGLKEAALADLEAALAIAPHDLAANRRLLAWGDLSQRRRAAADILSQDGDAGILARALAELRDSGQRAWAALTCYDGYVTGWVAWTGTCRITVSLSDSESSLVSAISSDAHHPLARGSIHAATIRMIRPRTPVPQRLVVACDDEPLQVRRLAPNLRAAELRPPGPRAAGHAPGPAPTVIVPVYADAPATRACLESLLAAKERCRLLVVNDASPDPEIRDYLAELASKGRIELLVNEINAGFVGAVNRGLRHAPSGDVILLNADTIVPPGFATRLAAAAHSAPDIGTVTPLSNNGEFFSFPVPDNVNEMQDYESIVRIDRVAADVNADITVDAPSGIGFCLYVTSGCLDAIGELSEHFERGYLEDVDLCLRARMHGFRNVCAPSVYIGHHGSRSFRHEKRALVLRNLRVLDHRFPGYRNECAAFSAADPLRPARARLERALPTADRMATIVAGHGATRLIAETRAAQIESEGGRAILLRRDAGRVYLAAANGGSPQSIDLDLSSKRGIAAAIDDLASLKVSRFEIFDHATSPALLGLGGKAGCAVCVWITAPPVDRAEKERLVAAAAAADAVCVSSPEAHTCALRLLPHCSPEVIPQVLAPLDIAKPDRRRPRSLAIVPAATSSASFGAITTLVAQFAKMDKRSPVVVAGMTINDAALLCFPDVFVTGAVGPDDLSTALASHNVGWFLVSPEGALFGHPLIEAVRRSSLPVAYWDGTSGSVSPRRGDLALTPGLSTAAMARAVTTWMKGARK